MHRPEKTLSHSVKAFISAEKGTKRGLVAALLNPHTDYSTSIRLT
jgi:hypothetical protein